MEMKRLPLHNVHIGLGAKMAPFAGFEMPVRYTSDRDEHHTVRSGVGVFDVSHMGEFLIEGSGALELVQTITSNDASKLQPGEAQYSCMTTSSGGIVDDLIVYHLRNQQYMLVVNASNIEKDWHWIVKNREQNVVMTNRSDETCLFAVQGPKATEVVQRLTSVDLKKVPYYHFAVGEFAGIADVILSNTGYTGAGGFEIYVPSNKALTAWDALFSAGRHEQIKPIGLGARDTLRLEMGYCLYGNDLDETTSPLEAGLGWITRFNKSFIGKEYLLQQKERGLHRKLVGFRMIDKGIPRHGYPIENTEGERIGIVTSGSQSPILEAGIGLGYVATPYATPQTEVFVPIRSNKLKAVIQKPPFI